MLLLNAAALCSAGVPFERAALLANHKAAAVAEEVASACIAFFGARGLTKECPLEKFYRDAKAAAVLLKPNDEQMEQIFRAVQKDYL